MTGSMSGNLQIRKQVMPSVTKGLRDKREEWSARVLISWMDVCVCLFDCVFVRLNHKVKCVRLKRLELRRELSGILR